MVGLSHQNVLGCDQYLVIPGNNIRSEESKMTTKDFVQTLPSIHHHPSPVCFINFSVGDLVCQCCHWRMVLVWQSQCRLEH